MTWLYVPSISAPDTAGSSSACDSPASTYEPFVTLSGTPTQRPLSWRGWKTRRWIERLYGTISSPSTAQRGVDEWISSLPASPASRSAPQGNVEASTTSDGCGPTSNESSTVCGHRLCSSRTSPDLFGTDCYQSLKDLPTSGSMRNGVCSPRPPLAPPTSANDSGFWPTATSTDFKRSGGNPTTTGTHGVTLTDRAVRMWPTATATDHEGNGFRSGSRSTEPKLAGAARMWGTPVARDDQKSPEAHLRMKANMPGGPRTEPTSLTVQAKMWPTPKASEGQRGTDPERPGRTGGPSLKQVLASGPLALTTSTDGPSGSPTADLNPSFVAALMGLPPGWLTPSTSVETASCRRWQQRHSPNWRCVLASPDESNAEENAA